MEQVKEGFVCHVELKSNMFSPPGGVCFGWGLVSSVSVFSQYSLSILSVFSQYSQLSRLYDGPQIRVSGPGWCTTDGEATGRGRGVVCETCET